MNPNMAMMLNTSKLLANPARHSFSSSIIDLMLGTVEVKGAEIEA